MKSGDSHGCFCRSACQSERKRGKKKKGKKNPRGLVKSGRMNDGPARASAGPCASGASELKMNPLSSGSLITLGSWLDFLMQTRPQWIRGGGGGGWEGRRGETCSGSLKGATIDAESFWSACACAPRLCPMHACVDPDQTAETRKQWRP